MDFVITGDGSKTLFNTALNEHYHSTHGAVQESRHVFLQAGLQFVLANGAVQPGQQLSILEVGFGTGLNFLLSADYCRQAGVALDYIGIEAYPLNLSTLGQTGYEAVVSPELWESFLAHYTDALQQKQRLDAQIVLEIAHQDVRSFQSQQQVDLLYFDAFASAKQPEMWSESTLAHVCKFLKPGGIFVTYAITGNLKRTIKSLGFSIEKLPGALGKREMLRARKL